MNALVDHKLKYIHMCTLRSALKLEILGMKRSRSPSAYILTKQKYELTGNREHVLEQLEILIREEKEAQQKEFANVHIIK